MNLYKVFLKHVFGAKYEGVKKNVFIVAIIFFAIYAAEIKMTIAPSVLFLTATLFTAGVMGQTLNSKSSMENLQGVLVQPFENRQLVFAYVFSLSAYTLLSKSALILVLFFAVGNWNIAEIMIALLCACNGCLFAVIGYLFRKKAKGILVLLWLAGYVTSIFCLKNLPLFGGIAGISLLLAVVLLFIVDAYAFYCPNISKTILKSNGKRGSFFVYLLRYLLANKNYLINTAGLGVIACVLPMILNQLGDFNALPMGLAILSLNTPLCILLSVDRDLEQAVRMLPGQGLRFGAKYCVFLAFVNLLLSSIYLVSWQLQFANVGRQMILVVVVFALQSALCSVVLEWVYPLRNWQLESDLYHHPRKYIVPAMMMLLAGFVSLWSSFVWVVVGLLVAEVLTIWCIGQKN
ncbi:MAG: hypothetical protein IKK33_07575 [Lachnospiraceae bacterium]|nr:hypothetical protein [Lachnospiraceae bacterium]